MVPRLIALLSLALAAQAGDPAAEVVEVAIAEGPDAALSYIDERPPEVRLELYDVLRAHYVFSGWGGATLDDVAELARTAIDDALSLSEEAVDSALSVSYLEIANVYSFNLAADLAECWPGDTLPREERHFLTGLEAAERCLQWRDDLCRGDYPMYMAHWVAGMHLLSLERPEDAMLHLETSLAHAESIAVAEGRPPELGPGAGFEVILAHGYIGIAEDMMGRGASRYGEALEAFEGAMEAEPTDADDYAFGLDQLQWARERVMEEE